MTTTYAAPATRTAIVRRVADMARACGLRPTVNEADFARYSDGAVTIDVRDLTGHVEVIAYAGTDEDEAFTHGRAFDWEFTGEDAAASAMLALPARVDWLRSVWS